jgi:hypothetical protein
MFQQPLYFSYAWLHLIIINNYFLSIFAKNNMITAEEEKQMGAIKGGTLTTQVCPLCNNFSTKRLTTLTQHFIDVHGTSPEEVWADMNGGRPNCACGCGGLTTWRGWGKGWGQVIIGHNAFIYAVYSPEEAAKISAARSAALTGKVGWCKGLTKDTDKRIADRGVATAIGRKEAFDAGDIIAWNKGLTKDTDVRVAEAATLLKQKFSTGEVVPWLSLIHI